MSQGLVAVDANILVYAYDAGSRWFAPAARALASLAQGAGPWAIPWPCVHEFLSVTTDPRLVSRTDAAAVAIRQIEMWMESPELRLIGELSGHWSELKRVLSAGQLRGGAVHDARIAAICLEHGVTELWSADRDFSRIAGPRVRNPLLD